MEDRTERYLQLDKFMERIIIRFEIDFESELSN